MAWTPEYGKKYRQKKLEELREKNRAYYEKNREREREKRRQYYLDNREAILQQTKTYRQQHPEQHRAQSKKWAAAHPERVREIHREAARRQRMENPEKYREAARKYRAAHPDRVKEIQRRHHKKHGKFNQLRRYYGLSAEQYNSIIASQNGLCALCGDPPDARGLMVDHCHKTGVVRGLLCNNCNHMLGCAKDNPTRIRAGIAYLAKYGITET